MLWSLIACASASLTRSRQVRLRLHGDPPSPLGWPSRAVAADCRSLVLLRHRQLSQQDLTVDLGLGAVASSLLALASSLLTICSRPYSTLKRRQALSRGKPPILPCPQEHLRASSWAAIARPRNIARNQLVISHRSGLIARHRRQIASVCDRVTLNRRCDAELSRLLSPLQPAFANIPREVMLRTISAASRIALAGQATAVRRLVAISSGLVSRNRDLTAICERLNVLDGARRLLQQNIDSPRGSLCLRECDLAAGPVVFYAVRLRHRAGHPRTIGSTARKLEPNLRASAWMRPVASNPFPDGRMYAPR